MARHADIAVGMAKEPQYFVTHNPLVDSPSGYLENWKARDLKARYLLDASTGYSKFPNFGDSAGLIADATKGAKIIYIMRDPIKRIESQVAHNVTRGRLDIERYEARHNHDFYHHYLITSSYAAQLKQYSQRFPKADMLLLSFEDMLAEPNETLTQVWQFLDLEPLAAESEFNHRNARRSVPQEFEGPILSDAIKAYLHDALAADMAELSSTWGVDTTKWGFK